jgi:hypothetical protein
MTELELAQLPKTASSMIAPVALNDEKISLIG